MKNYLKLIALSVVLLTGCSTTTNILKFETKDELSNTPPTYVTVYRWGEDPIWPEIKSCGEKYKPSLFTEKVNRDGATVRTYVCILKRSQKLLC